MKTETKDKLSTEVAVTYLISITTVIQILILGFVLGITSYCGLIFSIVLFVIAGVALLVSFYIEVNWIKCLLREKKPDEIEKNRKRKKFVLLQIGIMLLSASIIIGAFIYVISKRDFLLTGFTESSWRFKDEPCNYCGEPADGGVYKLDGKTYYCYEHYKEAYTTHKNYKNHETCWDCDKQFIDYSGSGGLCKRCKEVHQGMQDAVNKYS